MRWIGEEVEGITPRRGTRRLASAPLAPGACSGAGRTGAEDERTGVLDPTVQLKLIQEKMPVCVVTLN